MPDPAMSFSNAPALSFGLRPSRLVLLWVPVQPSSGPLARRVSDDSVMFLRMRTTAKTQPQRMKNGMLIMNRILYANAVAV